MKLVKFLAVFAAVIFILFCLARLGFWLLGISIKTDSSVKDLGISYGQLNLDSALNKLGLQVRVVTFNQGYMGNVQYNGEHPVSTSLTEEEFSAFINGNAWDSYPLKNVQFRINPDNSFEVSGYLVPDKVGSYLDIIEEGRSVSLKIVRLLLVNKKETPFYLRGKALIENNKSKFALNKVEISGYSLPSNISNWISPTFNRIIQQLIGFVNGLNLDSLTLNNGEVAIEGKFPDEEIVIIK